MKSIYRRFTGALVVLLVTAVILSGCGQSGEPESASSSGVGSSAESQVTEADAANTPTELEVIFGDEGEPFTLGLDDNVTASAIARYVGTSGWRLPIYEDDSSMDYDVMQYYDIPNSYEIPSNPESVTSAKAGEVYYSDPNRMVLFYKDAQVSGEYTKVGEFDATGSFVEAVENNPILEGWGNKIIQINQP